MFNQAQPARNQSNPRNRNFLAQFMINTLLVTCGKGNVRSRNARRIREQNYRKCHSFRQCHLGLCPSWRGNRFSPVKIKLFSFTHYYTEPGQYHKGLATTRWKFLFRTVSSVSVQSFCDRAGSDLIRLRTHVMYVRAKMPDDSRRNASPQWGRSGISWFLLGCDFGIRDDSQFAHGRCNKH